MVEDKILRYGRDHPTFKFMAYMLSHAMRIMHSEIYITVMAKIVYETAKAHTPELSSNTDENARKLITDTFLPFIQEQFPPIYVDEYLDNNVHAGFSKWSLDEPDISYAQSMIVSIKPRHIKNLIALSKSPELKNDYLALLYYNVETVLHEVGGHHLRRTADDDNHGTPDTLQTSGMTEGPEAGFYLAYSIHGGRALLVDVGPKGNNGYKLFEPYLQKKNEKDQMVFAALSTDAIKTMLMGGGLIPWTQTPCRVDLVL